MTLPGGTDPEARIYAAAAAVRDWYLSRGVRATVRGAHSSASRYVELWTPPAPGAPGGWPVLTIRVSDHAPAPDRPDPELTIYAAADPAAREASLAAALERFRIVSRPG